MTRRRGVQVSKRWSDSAVSDENVFYYRQAPAFSLQPSLGFEGHIPKLPSPTSFWKNAHRTGRFDRPIPQQTRLFVGEGLIRLADVCHGIAPSLSVCPGELVGAAGTSRSSSTVRLSGKLGLWCGVPPYNRARKLVVCVEFALIRRMSLGIL